MFSLVVSDIRYSANIVISVSKSLARKRPSSFEDFSVIAVTVGSIGGVGGGGGGGGDTYGWGVLALSLISSGIALLSVLLAIVESCC